MSDMEPIREELAKIRRSLDSHWTVFYWIALVLTFQACSGVLK